MIQALVYASPILDQHQQTESHTERIIENCHRMYTRHKHTTSALPNTYTSHTRAPTALPTPHNTNIKHNIHHIPYTKTHHT